MRRWGLSIDGPLAAASRHRLSSSAQTRLRWKAMQASIIVYTPTRYQATPLLHFAIRPMLQADGGDCELVDVTEDGVVKLRLQGACSGCPGAQMTLQHGIQRMLRERVDEGIEVEAVQ